MNSPLLKQLNIISLVKPSEESFPECVRYQYYAYCHLFRRYLESKYESWEKAETKYNRLMKIIFEKFIKVRENLRLIMMEIGIENLAEIIVETLNLKDLLLENY